MRNIVTGFIVILFTIIFSLALQAQYITLDKDGYTNVREKPNAQSTIVDVVKKYQVFYDAEDVKCYEVENTESSPSWLLVSTDMIEETGFIYKKNLFAVSDLPSLCKEGWFGDKTTLTCSNDSIVVTISKQPYNENNKLEGKRAYGTDGWMPYNEIKEISIDYKGKKMYIPESQFKNYYDPGYISIWLGFDGEIYILISGGDGSGGYDVILSVVNGEVVYSLPSEC